VGLVEKCDIGVEGCLERATNELISLAGPQLR
jgi:hypothetical protein